ncbi:hypothetical protein JAAARDRAFT_198367 [Jaapia argillacea MUCL 33604]|uniref:Uncharacterized protein n=1 Tax=Jaapia argillacea MUCL 33604 TaxID=933084 RepID=A0A067PCJ6_9AGAM|nr:hypothetical protein JAAARDRAFT_198367 [Jaapia argillacea MUCL 33604]
MSSSYHDTPKHNGSYDAALLAAAPVATRAEKQEGYNVDLLDNGRPNRAASTSPGPATVLTPHRSDPELAASKERYANGLSPSSSAKVPFWRTTKGLIILVVVAIVIIGAVVGGAVGGTAGKKKSTNGGVGGGTNPGSAPDTSSVASPSASITVSSTGSTGSTSVPEFATGTTAGAFSSISESSLGRTSTISSSTTTPNVVSPNPTSPSSGGP